MGHGHDVRRGAARARLHVAIKPIRLVFPSIKRYRLDPTEIQAPRAWNDSHLGPAGIAAVLTGDLIGSSHVPPACPGTGDARSFRRRGGDRRLDAWTPDRDPRFTRYRGDGWQMHRRRIPASRCAPRSCSPPGSAPPTSASPPAPPSASAASRASATESLADARGAAFEASGHALDDMAPPRRLAIEGPASRQLPPRHRGSRSTNGGPLDPAAGRSHGALPPARQPDARPPSRQRSTLRPRRSTTGCPAPAPRRSAGPSRLGGRVRKPATPRVAPHDAHRPPDA